MPTAFQLALVSLAVLLSWRASPATGPAPEPIALFDLATPIRATGEPLEGTLIGPPGHYFAVAASPTDRGLVLGGVPLALGADAVVLATGRLDPAGRAWVSVEAPDGLVHLQALLAPAPDLAVFALTGPKRAWTFAAPASTLLPGDGRPPAGEVGSAGRADAHVTDPPRPTPAGTSEPRPRAGTARADVVLACVGCVLADTIAAGAVGAAQADLTELQARVDDTCPPGQAVRAIGVDGAVTCDATRSLDPRLVATLRWDLLPRAAGSPFATGGDSPLDGAFDGSHLWVANNLSNTVAKIRVDTGVHAPGSPFPTGGLGPRDVAFDGTYVWITNRESNSVAKLRADTGQHAPGSPFPAGGIDPQGVAFDGTHIWVAHSTSNPGTVAKLDAATGQPVPGSPFLTGGTDPHAVAFDGTHVWIIHPNAGTVAKLRAATGLPAPGSPFSTGGDFPFEVAFDGAHVWIPNQTSGTVAKLDVTTGLHVLGSPFPTGGVNPRGLAFDGADVWVSHATVPGSVARLRADTGTPVSGSPLPTGGDVSQGVVFDGTHVWVLHAVSPGSAAKLSPRRRRRRASPPAPRRRCPAGSSAGRRNDRT